MNSHVCMFLVLALGAIPAAGQEESPQVSRFGRDGGGVFKLRIEPHWSADGNHFWYRNDLAGGRREFILVDAVQGERKSAFDHDRLSRSLSDALGSNVAADRLPLEDLEFDLEKQELQFRARGARWRCSLEKSYEIAKIDDAAPAPSARQRGDAPRASTRTGAEMTLTFANQTAGEVELFWIDAEGRERSYGKLAPGEKKEQHTYAGHVWEVRDSQGRTLLRIEADENAAEAEIAENAPQAPPRRPGGFGFRRRPDNASPDGKWTALIRDHNVFVRSTEDGAEFQLTQDGKDGLAYDLLEWSPDSATLVAFRVEPAERKDVYLVESSPRDGGRARLHTRTYDLPGDKFASYELRLFNVAEQKAIPCDAPEDRSRPPAIPRDRSRRAHRRNPQPHRRADRDLHLDRPHGEPATLPGHLAGQDRRDRLRLRAGRLAAPVPDRRRRGRDQEPDHQGEYVVRGIDRIDEENRQIWFRASGKNPDQDPYFIHYYRVNFDGTGLSP
jgi:dipeptidyl-peptidase 4